MLHFGYVLSLLAILSLGCGVISTPVMQTPSPPPQAATQVLTQVPLDLEEAPTQKVDELPELPNSALVDIYDPARDPADDLKQAIVFAQRQNKRIMLELGGDWCIWCKWMDEFYTAHKDILQFRADHYVLVKVNVSKETITP